MSNPIDVSFWIKDMLGSLAEFASALAIEKDGDAYAVVLRLHIPVNQLLATMPPALLDAAQTNGAKITLEDETVMDVRVPIDTAPVAFQPGHQEVTKKEEEQKKSVIIKRAVGAKPMSQQQIRQSLGLNDEE